MLQICFRKQYISILNSKTVTLSVGDPGTGPGGPPPPLLLDQTEARGARKFFFESGAPPFSQGVDDRPPPLSEGLDKPLIMYVDYVYPEAYKSFQLI